MPSNGRNEVFCLPINQMIGTSFEAKRWLSLDTCGLLGVSCSWFVHLFSFFVLSTKVIAGSMFATAVFVLLYVPVSLLAMSSLYMAWTSDPGAVPMGARPLVTVRRASSGDITSSAPTTVSSASSNGKSSSRRRGLRRCHKCADNFKAPRAHHDSVTGRCIVKFDHFCPWVGNAVGALNHKFFVLFIGYTLCSCILSLSLLVLRAIHCGYVTGADSESDDVAASTGTKDGDHRRALAVTSRILASTSTVQAESSASLYEPECIDWYTSYLVLALVIVSLVFLVFTCTMLIDQVEAIETNTSKIARMKMSVGQAGTELSRVTEEFNEMFGGETKEVGWHWFLPLPVEFPAGMEKVVLGYEWDETFDPVPYDDGSAPSNGGARIEMSTMSGSHTTTTTPPPSGNLPVRVKNGSSPRRDIEAGSLTPNDAIGTNASFGGSSPTKKAPALIKRSTSKSSADDEMRLT